MEKLGGPLPRMTNKDPVDLCMGCSLQIEEHSRPNKDFDKTGVTPKDAQTE